MTIYIDVLFCVNFIVDYIILLSVKRLRGLSAHRGRLLLGAFLGGIGSFVILIDKMPFLLSSLLSTAEVLIITAVSFLPAGLRSYIKTVLTMFLISSCYCGMMTAMLKIFSLQNVAVRNNTVYIGISPLMLTGATLLSYIIMRVVLTITGKGESEKTKYKVRVEYKGKTVELQGTVDTGNTLHEPFSGECVIVGRADMFGDMLDAKRYMNADKGAVFSDGIRLVPFKSIGGNGVIPAFKPSRISLSDDKRKFEVNAYLGLCDENNLTDGFDLILPSELVTKGS